MNEFFNNLKNEAHNIRLSQGEKQRMRARLYEAMQSPAFDVPTPARRARSPYTFFQFVHVRVMVPALAVLVVVLGSGTAFAAQGSLPGSPLYQVKVNIDEPIRVALATTPAAKATVNAQIAQTRLMEAQTLEAEGKLDATTTQELQQNFDEHAQSALAFIASTTPVVTATSEEGVATGTTALPPQETHAANSTSSPRGKHRGSFAAFAATPSGTTTPAAATTTTTSNSSGENFEDIPASLQHQRQLFNEIRQRVDSHDFQDTRSSGQGDSQGGSNGGGRGGEN